MKAKLRQTGGRLLSVLFWVVVWQILSKIVGEELLLPSPASVAREWLWLLGTADFWRAAAGSLLRVVAGFLAAVVVGSGLAMLTARSRVARWLLSPLLYLVRATPVASFIVLALVWIKTGMLPLVISFLMVVPVIWDNVEQGIGQTDPLLLEMAQVYRLSRRQVFWHIRVPAVMPYLLAAMTTGVGFAWKSAVAAEILCYPGQSIGAYLYRAKLLLETPAVFAWTGTAVLLSVGLSWLTKRLTTRWRERFSAD